MNPITALSFHDTQFDVIDRTGQPWLRGYQIGSALEYSQPDAAIAKLYDRNADEFTDAMTALVELDTNGGKQQTRIFSLRGCHLLGMLARTKIAKEFRRWVLDVLDQIGQEGQPQHKPAPAPVHYPLTRPELPKCREKVACVDRYFRFHSSSAIAAAIYAPLFQKFGISRMEQLNAMDLPLVLEILQRMQDDAHAYYLEGVRRERSAMTALYSCAGLPLPHLAAGQMELPA